MAALEEQIAPLSLEQLEVSLEMVALDFTYSNEVDAFEGLFCQPRAERALDAGLTIAHPSYNIYVAGLTGMRKEAVLERAVRRRVRHAETPPDWVYVNNFADPYRPIAVALPAGQGTRFRRDMEKLTEQLYDQLPSLFESEALSREKEKLHQRFQDEGRELSEQTENRARARNFSVHQLPNGQVVLRPMRAGEPLSSQQIQELSPSEKEQMNKDRQELAQEITSLMSKHQELGRQLAVELDRIEKTFAERFVQPLVEELAERYSSPKLAPWFHALKDHILEHLDVFRHSNNDNQSQQLAQAFGIAQNDQLRVYNVNVLVDNSEVSGPPVVVEGAPNYKNLFGIIDQSEGRLNRNPPDFLNIKAGSLLQASGGYLVFDLADGLLEPVVWKELKRTLKRGALEIEAYEPLGLFSTSALKPEPIPLDVKLVVVGPVELYQLLYAYDAEFREIFKVKAEFDSETRRTPETARILAAFVEKLRQNEPHIPVFHASAILELLHAGARLAEHRNKMTTELSRIADLVREATLWARQDGSEQVAGPHVRQAIDERLYRSSLLAEKVQELVQEGTLRVRVAGDDVGTVNGLALVDTADEIFSRPSRVTASTAVGADGLVNIERESRLSGRTFDKGVLILHGYFRNTYGARPMAFSASLAMEQSYGPVSGDSASVAELLALLSALSGVPFRQDLAVTGSINQWGEIQAIGGINRKVEGFFDICNARGLTGTQGVVLPAANQKNLVLRPDVLDAIRQSSFWLWTVDHIDQALTLFSRLPAGSPEEPGTLHGHVAKNLMEMARRLREEHPQTIQVVQPSVESPPQHYHRGPRLPGQEP